MGCQQLMRLASLWGVYILEFHIFSAKRHHPPLPTVYTALYGKAGVAAAYSLNFRHAEAIEHVT